MLEDEALRLLEGSSADAFGPTLAYELDMRYRGQAYNLTVPLAPRPVTAATMAGAVDAFEGEHRRLYGYTPSVTDTEIVTLRLRAVARISEVDWGAGTDEVPAPRESVRRVWWDGEWSSWRVVARTGLADGDRVGAGTIVEQEDTTVVVPPGWQGVAAAAGTLVLERDAA